MHYILAKKSDLTEILPLRCNYLDGRGLQVAIHGIGLQPLQSNLTLFLNYTSFGPSEAETLIADFIGNIDFASLLIILSHPVLRQSINSETLLNQYQIPATAHVYKTLEQSVSWSQDVLHWLVQKKIKPHDISFLNLLPGKDVCELLEKTKVSSLSKSDILKLLESISELILMKRDLGALLDLPWDEKTIALIQGLRFPLSTIKNPIRQVELRWPKNVSTTPKRILDKMGFQVQFFVSHPQELNQTLVQLEKMIPDWAEKIQEKQ